MQKNDSVIAQMILSNNLVNTTGYMYHCANSIYSKTNERIQEYIDLISNKEEVLSVIASSDQILNMILHGSKKIDGFDISAFPKYYMYLKLAAISSLSYNDYINFFYEIDKDSEIYDDMYFYCIRNNIDSFAKVFWDDLINFFDWNEINQSTIFSSEAFSLSDTISQNDYLKEKNFNKLKDMINKVSISTIDGNILNIYRDLKNKYDLVYLSNIIDYVSNEPFKIMMESLQLKEDGLILNYIFNYKEAYKEFFKEKCYEFQKVEDTNSYLLIKR